MRITKVSVLTGAKNTREINISEEQLQQFNAGRHVQWVVPHLSADDREFLISGATPEEWEAAFGEDGDDQEDQEVL